MISREKLAEILGAEYGNINFGTYQERRNLAEDSLKGAFHSSREQMNYHSGLYPLSSSEGLFFDKLLAYAVETYREGAYIVGFMDALEVIEQLYSKNDPVYD